LAGGGTGHIGSCGRSLDRDPDPSSHTGHDPEKGFLCVDADRSSENGDHIVEVLGFVVLGLVTGLIASTMGVGGGIIFVPSLVVFFGFAQQTAQGTSLAIILPTAMVGTYLHAKKGRVEWRVVLLIAAGGVVGGLIGSRAALALDPDLLRRMFAALLVAIAIRMLSS